MEGPQYDNKIHDDMLESSMYTIFGNFVQPKLFPLSQYKFIDPCKKCLVRSSCKPHEVDCPEHDKHFLWKSYLAQKKSIIKGIFKRPVRIFITIFNILLIWLVSVGIGVALVGMGYIAILSWSVAYQAWFL